METYSSTTTALPRKSYLDGGNTQKPRIARGLFHTFPIPSILKPKKNPCKN